MHPFDQAIELTERDQGLHGEAPLAYWNMVGPYGGITAAIVMAAVMRDPRREAEPLALTVNYCAPVQRGPYEIERSLVRTNRSTQHWRVEMIQTDPKTGEPMVVVQAMAVFGARRDLWSGRAAKPPTAASPEGLARRRGSDEIAWFQRYDIRFDRHPFKSPPDEPVLHWVRDDPPRPLDSIALASLCDTFFPTLFARRQTVVPVATVSMNIYFHVGAAELAAVGDAWLLGEGRSNAYHRGFFDAEARLWHGEQLLATTHQVMWYRQ
ncbi:MAG: thioesterase family protein [Burkholderiaceae bacterium]